MSCLFNSFDPYFKQPFGAVRAGQTVRLSLCIPEELGYVDPHLVLKKEGKFDVPVYYRMNFDGQTPRQNHFSVEVPLNDPGLYFYYFDLYTDFRRIVRGPDNCGVISWQDGESWQITVYEQDFETPESIKGKVFYQIFPDRFCEGVENKPMPFADRIYQADKHAEPFWQPNEVGGHLNEDYFGGDLKGIQQKLPYLHEMGVDFIYLNPIFEAHSNHRYNTADYLNVDPLLGTNEDFETLCKEAAKYGIGIVLDGVFSHTGSDSRYFNREGRYGEGGAYRDPNSPYRSWYDFDPKYKGGYRSWWGFETLPEVNEETPSFVEFITGEGGVIDTWLRRGAAGFRLDVADELPDEFIEKIRTAVKRVSPEKFLLGEVWEDATTKFGFNKRRTYLLGNGSNTLFSDAGFGGAVICLTGLNSRFSMQAQPDGSTKVLAPAGMMLSALCNTAQKESLAGLEFAFGIPGTVGGAVYMNAGAYGGEIKDVLTAVTFLDENLHLQTLPVQELQLGYRTSIFERCSWCILEAEFTLHPGDAQEIHTAMQEYMRRRKEKQPLEYPSAGSTFKRPVGQFAGKLIEDCGLRGFRVGGAAISEKHCGFVVNLGNATCADVVSLTEQVRQIVLEKTGCTLEREIRVVE